MVQFRPLRVDHHGWQIFLAMLILWQALRPASRGAGLLGGLFAAMLLAVSIEGLPLAALFAGIAALRWALAGDAAEIGRASWRARVCPYVSSTVVAASLKKKKHTN